MGRGGGNGRLERKKKGCGWAKSLDGSAGCWASWAESEENSFPNKIWFLNIPRLWKFVGGDLGGILT
jgi:hypothetical protein